MKVLHVINDITTAGAEKLLVDLLPYMATKGIEAHILISNGIMNSKSFEDKLSAAKIRVINFKTSFYNPIQVHRIARLINRENYDIVHAHLFPTQYWVALASIFTKNSTVFIKTEHSVTNERKQLKILQPLEKFVYSRFQYLIGITDEASINLQNWLKRNKGVITINNGVNLNEIHKAHKNIDFSKYTFLKKENKNLLMVGRFDGIHKDQETIVRSLIQLPENYYLFFAGQGSHEKVIKKLVKNLGLTHRVHFLGIRDDIYKLMHLVDLNILSTKQEGLSGVALESLASGKPFIGSDVSGVREIVPSPLHLFSPENPNALKEKIELIFSNEEAKQQNVQSALLHVKQYDTSKMADAYIDLYQKSMLIITSNK